MTHPLFDLSGRVALVTGAASGMGRAMAIGFAEVGADLMLVDINTEGVERTAEHIASLGRRAIPVTCDSTDLDALDKLFAQLDSEYGRIDVLGNVYGPGSMSQPEETPISEVQYVLHGLVVARFRACQLAGQRMLKAGRGSIINIGSIGGVTSLGRGQAAYGMGMAAQVMNAGLAERVNQVPGLADVFLRGIPAARFGKPDDIKGLAIFLASDASEWITGAIIPMDGGNLAKNSGGSHPGMPGMESNLT
jgi:NAD(P)-dependent dehydrogenase (short-subunit alcohol dehydrogenase family)